MTDDLQQLLLTILEQQPDGIAEHALLRELQAVRGEAFPDTLFREPLALFRAHFLLFHALYRLRDALQAERTGLLHIDPLGIRLTAWTEAGDTVLAGRDPMRDYYLDLAHLEDTGAEDVQRLLGDFWGRYYANGRRGEALAVLGLAADADLDDAQRRYRELAMQHHPDRGGDPARFQAIREAIAVLRRC